MIKYKRSYPSPKSLTTEFQKGKNGSYRTEDVVSALKAIFHNKCYICGLNELTDHVVEHLRPHHNGKFLNLKFDWDNLFLCCPHCNGVKNKQKYDGTILDCCLVEIKTCFTCTIDNGAVRVIPKSASLHSTRTAELIEEVFNPLNGAIRKTAGTARKARLLKEMNTFLSLLEKYQDNKEMFREMILSRLRSESAFTAFKRDHIRTHKDEYPEFQEYV